MSIQKLHAFEKTAIQARHAVKRLEMLADIAHTEEEKVVAGQLLEYFKAIRSTIPFKYRDTDLKEKE